MRENQKVTSSHDIHYAYATREDPNGHYLFISCSTSFVILVTEKKINQDV